MDAKTITLPKVQVTQYYYLILAVSFFVPFFVTGPQLLTGSLVNTLLFLSVYFFDRNKALPLLILPSIGAVGNGLLFSTFTPFLLYFLPFVWGGNFILLRVFEYTHTRQSPAVAIGVSSVLKAAFLFAAASIYVGYRIVPGLFLQAMGLFQLVTAVVGGITAYSIYKYVSKQS